jgi:hypothetical protein
MVHRHAELRQNGFKAGKASGVANTSGVSPNASMRAGVRYGSEADLAAGADLSPLLPAKRTSSGVDPTSALGHKRTFVVFAPNASSRFAN